MNHERTRFNFNNNVDANELRDTLNLALIATAILHGEDKVRLHAHNTISGRVIEIDTSHEVGAMLAVLLLGYARREYPPSSFTSEKVTVMQLAGGKASLS